MDTFANYILSEKESLKKMEIVYYMKQKIDIFFNKTAVLKAEVAKLFMDIMNIDIDKNLVITSCLLYACKKTDSAQELEKIRAYPRESAEFLKTLGFDDDFCTICQAHSRYDEISPRPRESDILELVDQFGGMILNRPERIGLKVDESICLLENRNLKDKENVYLEQFKVFVENSEEFQISLKSDGGKKTPILHLLASEINAAESTLEAIRRIARIREIAIKED